MSSKIAFTLFRVLCALQCFAIKTNFWDFRCWNNKIDSVPRRKKLVFDKKNIDVAKDLGILMVEKTIIQGVSGLCTNILTLSKLTIY